MNLSSEIAANKAGEALRTWSFQEQHSNTEAAHHDAEQTSHQLCVKLPIFCEVYQNL